MDKWLRAIRKHGVEMQEDMPSSTELLSEGLLHVRSRLSDVQKRIVDVDDVQHILMAYQSRLNRVITMLQAIELEKKNEEV